MRWWIFGDSKFIHTFIYKGFCVVVTCVYSRSGINSIPFDGAPANFYSGFFSCCWLKWLNCNKLQFLSRKVLFNLQSQRFFYSKEKVKAASFMEILNNILLIYKCIPLDECVIKVIRYYWNGSEIIIWKFSLGRFGNHFIQRRMAIPTFSLSQSMSMSYFFFSHFFPIEIFYHLNVALCYPYLWEKMKSWKAESINKDWIQYVAPDMFNLHSVTIYITNNQGSTSISSHSDRSPYTSSSKYVENKQSFFKPGR